MTKKKTRKPGKHWPGFWGDPAQGEKLERLIDRKFGTYFGSRKVAIGTLGLSRRLMNMYITGERAIPDHVWKHLKLIPDFDPRAVPVQAKKAVRRKTPATKAYSDFVRQHNSELVKGRRAVPAILFIDDDTDPLS